MPLAVTQITGEGSLLLESQRKKVSPGLLKGMSSKIGRVLTSVFLLAAILLTTGGAFSSIFDVLVLPDELILSPPQHTQELESSEEGNSASLAATLVKAPEAVVRVEGDLPYKQIVGTGFFISPTGLVATNRHVVERSDAVYSITTSDGRVFDVESVLKSEEGDVAILKTNARAVPWLSLEDSIEYELGQPVMALGAGIHDSRAVGLLSGAGQSVITDANTVEEDVIQVQALIRPGDSGGPLLNTDGKVIGVVFARDAAGENLGFAIPVEKVAKLVPQALAEGPRVAEQEQGPDIRQIFPFPVFQGI